MKEIEELIKKTLKDIKNLYNNGIIDSKILGKMKS